MFIFRCCHHSLTRLYSYHHTKTLFSTLGFIVPSFVAVTQLTLKRIAFNWWGRSVAEGNVLFDLLKFFFTIPFLPVFLFQPSGRNAKRLRLSKERRECIVRRERANIYIKGCFLKRRHERRYRKLTRQNGTIMLNVRARSSPRTDQEYTVRDYFTTVQGDVCSKDSARMQIKKTRGGTYLENHDIHESCGAHLHPAFCSSPSSITNASKT